MPAHELSVDFIVDDLCEGYDKTCDWIQRRVADLVEDCKDELEYWFRYNLYQIYAYCRLKMGHYLHVWGMVRQRIEAIGLVKPGESL